MPTLNPAQIAEIKSAYQNQMAAQPPSSSSVSQTTLQLNPSQIQEIQQAYKSSLMTPSNIGNQIKAGGSNLLTNAPMPQASQDALNQLGGWAPTAGNAAYNFAQGAVHPFTPTNSIAGIAGQVGALAPLGDVGGLLRAGRAIPAIGNALGKAGDFLNPAMAQGLPGMMGRSALNSSIGGSAIGAMGASMNGSSPMTGGLAGATGGALLGAVAPAIPELGSAVSNMFGLPNLANKLSTASKIAASKFLGGPVKTVQDFVSNLTGGAAPNEIAGKAVNSINELKDNTQEISNNAFTSLMQKADQMGVNAANPTMVWQQANQLSNEEVPNMVDPKYNQVKNDIQSAQNLFRGGPINPATGAPISQPTMQALNNFKIAMNNRAYQTGQDEYAQGIYKQLANSAKQEVDNRLAKTPLGTELTANNQYFQDHVLPLREIPNDIGADGLQSFIKNENNSGFAKAISSEAIPPGAPPSPILAAHNQMLQNFQQTKGTTPENLTKGFLISNIDSEKNMLDPDGTLRSYYNLANSGKTDNSKGTTFLFPSPTNINPSLFKQPDTLQMGALAKNAGFFNRNAKIGDSAYETAAALGHSNSAAWVAKNSTNILSKYLPQYEQYFDEPVVKAALQNGGIPAAQRAIQGLIQYPGIAKSLPGVVGGLGAAQNPI